MNARPIINHLYLLFANSLPRYRKFNTLRRRTYLLAGLKIGEETKIIGPLHTRPDSTQHIIIGARCYINADIRLSVGLSTVTIGEGALIGPKVSFETAGHSVNLDANNERRLFSKAIKVEDNTWIGAGAIILAGVTIGYGAVVAAGAVVTKDVQPNTVVGGVPAKFLKNINE